MSATMHDDPRTSAGVRRWIEEGARREAVRAARDAEMRTMRFDTIAAHGVFGLEEALASDGSLHEPLVLSPAQVFADADQMEAALGYLMPSWTYSRIANPTLAALEGTLTLLETYGSDVEASAVVTASGMAAIHMATNPFLGQDASLPPPNVVASARCYGGTFMLFSQRYAAERGIEIRWITDPRDLGAWDAAIDGGTRFVYGETPSNPSLALVDVPALADLAHARGIPLIVDPTVATPALLRPLAMGADVVVQSLSKAIGGSGLAIGGAVIARRDLPSKVGPPELREDFATHVKLLPFRDHGPALSPFNAAMILTDLRTLRGRVDRWSRGAAHVAAFLETHPRVEAVHYPGLASHPDHDLACRDLWLADGDDDGQPVNRFGSLLAFDVAGGPARARAVFDGLRLIRRATDLGRVKSIATIPAISTHQQQGEEGRALAGIPGHQIRLSVGGEDPRDVIADLERALHVLRFADAGPPGRTGPRGGSAPSVAPRSRTP
jgi:O-acetylhomoserine/O-acetylserine sulfhydrylase-like pyridoxal-dependent enzyme